MPQGDIYDRKVPHPGGISPSDKKFLGMLDIVKITFASTCHTSSALATRAKSL